MMKIVWSVLLIFLMGLTPIIIRPNTLDCNKVVNYQINARLNVAEKTIAGEQILTWRNTTNNAVSELYFHAYLNAFKNNKSSFLKKVYMQNSTGYPELKSEQDYGYLEIKKLSQVQENQSEFDLLPGVVFTQPDDNNPEDQTVFKVTLRSPVASGQTTRLKISFLSRLPKKAPRIGYSGNFFFVGQWFPKIGVLEETGWNCHQYHRFSEFYADYGDYDVNITVPEGFIVGAVGVMTDSTINSDGTCTVRYQQQCVHDFAWSASPDFVMKTARFSQAGLPDVQIKVLLQPEHQGFADAYIKACQATLKYFGLWYGPYVYPQITVVDPVWSSWAGGMEYPTMFSGEVTWQVPEAALEPHGVTIHEAGHQWWYGMIGTNETEHAWMDEGFNSYSTARCLVTAFGQPLAYKSYFGFSISFPEARIDPRYNRFIEYSKNLTDDILDQPVWLYRNRTSYRANSYGKGSMLLWTLEGYLGEEIFSDIMRSYATRYRFQHPGPEQFTQVVNEIAPQNMDWFFSQALKTNAVLDYAVGEVINQPVYKDQGYFSESGVLKFKSEKITDNENKEYISQVVVRRLGAMYLPVEVQVTFENGDQVIERWDGQANWQRFTYRREQKIATVIIDPERKLWLDVNYQNNSYLVKKKSLSTLKWTFKWMFWLQHLMEVFAFYS